MKKLALYLYFLFLFTLFICQSAEASVYFPHVVVGGSLNWGTEICVINTGSETITGTFEAYDDDGDPVSVNINVTLTANARKQITVGNEFTNPSDIGYIIFNTDSECVIGYTKFYIVGKYRVAVPAITDINTGDLYITHIASGNGWWTGVSIVNTLSTAKTLTIEFDDGTTKTVSIAGKEHKIFTIKSLFGNTPQPDLQSAVIKNANGVIGLELFCKSNQLSGILLKNDTTKTMHYPHIATSGWWTGIVAYNPLTSSCALTVKPYTAAGTALTTKTITLAGKKKYIGSVTSLGLPTNAAWFAIESTNAITGFELFGTSDGNRLAGYTGVNISSKEGVFAKIEKNGWTGIAFVNITGNTAGVELMAFDDAGTLIATRSITLNPYQKMVDNPENLFTTDISSATYIYYSSCQELVGFQLNNSTDNMMLDALPGLFANGCTGDVSQYDGGYYGTYSGDASGDWCFEIYNGEIQGWAWDDDGDDYEVTGNLAGDGSLAVGTADDSTTFSGTIDSEGNISGTWEWFGFGIEPDEDGTFKGQAGDCPQGDITIDDDIDMVVEGVTDPLTDEGVSEAALLTLEALSEMGLVEALGSDSVLELLTTIGAADPQCGDMTVNKLSGTVVYTITGGEGCVFTSGTITISNIRKTENEISFDAEFDTVQSDGCSLDGNAEVTVSEKGPDQINIEMVFDDMETCNGNIDGTFEAVYDFSTEELVSATATVTASYMVDETDVDIEADLEFNSSGQVNGTILLTVDGILFHCTLKNIIIDDNCGIPTAGTLTIKASGSNGLEEDVVFDFSSTTCANPTVTTTINGRTVTYNLS